MKMIKAKYIETLCLTLLLPLFFGCTGQNDSKDGVVTNDDIISENTDNQSYIEFDTIEHDFGTLIEGEQVVFYFDYTNTGEGDLLINSVKSSCGCTVPDWSRKPLGPGMKGTIKVKFDTSGREGEQMKIVTILSNSENYEVRLNLKANIVSD